MPPPRKVDLLPSSLKTWLQEEMKDRGFGGYEELAEALNWRLETEGVELRIQKSALHAYGQEYENFVRYQNEASSWAANWLNDEGLADEAKRHGVLFQMLTTLAFKAMQNRMAENADIDPKELHFIGRMLKDVMASAGLREKLVQEDRAAQAAKLDDAFAAGDIDKAIHQKAREVMGFG